jgi:hypothetical protein
MITLYPSTMFNMDAVFTSRSSVELEQVFVGMSLRTYLEAAFKDGKAPLDPSTLVCSYLFDDICTLFL